MSKKEILKIVLIALLIVGIIIFSIYKYKAKQEEIVLYSEEIPSFNESSNINKIILEEVEELIKVYITGAVNFPGVKELPQGSRIEDVINIAGGVTSDADITGVNLAYEISDGQKIYIPKINEKIEKYITEENEEGIIEDVTSANKLININKADIKRLTELPGVGEALAKRIIEYREENGDFKNVEDLKNVSGIGDKKFDSLREYISIK